jgi:hypothetical protein
MSQYRASTAPQNSVSMLSGRRRYSTSHRRTERRHLNRVANDDGQQRAAHRRDQRKLEGRHRRAREG